jgi:hypothetical protein
LGFKGETIISFFIWLYTVCLAVIALGLIFNAIRSREATPSLFARDTDRRPWWHFGFWVAAATLFVCLVASPLGAAVLVLGGVFTAIGFGWYYKNNPDKARKGGWRP